LLLKYNRRQVCKLNIIRYVRCACNNFYSPTRAHNSIICFKQDSAMVLVSAINRHSKETLTQKEYVILMCNITYNKYYI
jgi:hypothetical protein